MKGRGYYQGEGCGLLPGGSKGKLWRVAWQSADKAGAVVLGWKDGGTAVVDVPGAIAEIVARWAIRMDIHHPGSVSIESVERYARGCQFATVVLPRLRAIADNASAIGHK